MGSDGGLSGARFAAAKGRKMLNLGHVWRRVITKRAMYLQEYDGLVFGAVAEPEPSTIGHVLGGGHGAALLAAIRPFAGRGVCVEADEAVGG